MDFGLQTDKTLYTIELDYKQFKLDKEEIIKLIKEKDDTLRNLISEIQKAPPAPTPKKEKKSWMSNALDKGGKMIDNAKEEKPEAKGATSFL